MRLIDIHTIIAASPRILVLLWAVTLPFLAFAGWLFLFLANQEASPVPAGVLAGLFLLIAVTLLVGTAELTHHYLRYDAVRLTFTGEPPLVGKRLDAVIDLPLNAAGAWVGAELACVRLHHESIGANRTAIFENDCWSEKHQFPVRRNGRRDSAVVRFDIPDSLPPSGDAHPAGAPACAQSGRDQYIWELRIQASGANLEFRRTLGVHVLPPPPGFTAARPAAESRPTTRAR
ncbi:MAG: hypothetical protein GEV05_18400 [Betaproteobacteria bacterium]|nr:hypothetical protein [Betaproteobacteria bacterium]